MSRAESTARRDQRYAAFGDRLYRAAFAARQAVAGSLALTHRCNLRCVHCYLAEERHTPEQETGFWIDLLDQLQAAGCLWLTLTGGEPLLRPDFAQIYTAAKRRGMLVSVFTNGTLLDEAHLALFAELPPFAVEISLYGATEATCAQVTGVSGACEAALDAARRLAGQGVRLQLKTVALRQNTHELEGLKTLARELDVGFRFDSLITPCTDGARHPCTTRLADDDLLRLDIEDPDRRAAWADCLAGCLAEGGAIKRTGLFDCGAGRTSFHVSPEGRLGLCLSDPPMVDLTDSSFQAGWDGPIRERRDTPLPADHPCLACEDLVFCGLCPPLSRMETGSDLGVPEQLCQLGKRRRKTLAAAG